MEFRKSETSDHSSYILAMINIASLCPFLGVKPMTVVYEDISIATMAGNYVIGADEGVPVCWAAWGKFNAITAARYRQPLVPNVYTALNTGKDVWITHLCAPMLPQHRAELLGELKRQHPNALVFDGQSVRKLDALLK